MIGKGGQKAYVSAICNSKNIPPKFHAVLDALLDRAYFNDEFRCMEIVVNTYVKKKVAEKVGLKSPGPVNSCVKPHTTKVTCFPLPA